MRQRTLCAFKDDLCVFGYAFVCRDCQTKPTIPRHIHIDKPIDKPPGYNRILECEICGKRGLVKSSYEC